MRTTEERRPNLFTRQQDEYAALRQYVRLAATPENSASGAVRRAINSELTPRQRELITMYYLDQMLMEDIAEELGLNVSSVSRTLARGRERLKKILSYGGARLLSELEDF